MPSPNHSLHTVIACSFIGFIEGGNSKLQVLTGTWFLQMHLRLTLALFHELLCAVSLQMNLENSGFSVNQCRLLSSRIWSYENVFLSALTPIGWQDPLHC